MAWWNPRTWGKGEEAAPPKRGFDAAKRGRLQRGWAERPDGVARMGSRDLPTLRRRARDAERNSSLGHKALWDRANFVVGPGFRPVLKEHKELVATWDAWGRQCDASAQYQTVDGLIFTAYMSMLLSGGAIIRRRRRRIGDTYDGTRTGERLVVPMQLELLEADLVNLKRNEVLDNGHQVQLGKEYDLLGRVVAYYLLRVHPEDVSSLASLGVSALDDVRVPAESVIHLFEARGRAGLIHGWPRGHASLQSLWNHGEGFRMERTRRRAAAALVASVEGEGELPFETDGTPEGINVLAGSDGEPVEQIESGMVVYPPAGRRVVFPSLPSAEGFEDFARRSSLEVCAGFRMPYERVVGDLRGASYSTTKYADVGTQRDVETEQRLVVIPQMVQRLWDWCMGDAVAAGLHTEEETAERPKWVPAAWPSASPEKDAQADERLVRSGWMTNEDCATKRGVADYDDLLDRREEELKDLDRRGIVVDTDPRKVARAGTAQPDAQLGDGGGGDGET